MSVKIIFCLLLVYTFVVGGCRKSLLNEKPSSEIFVPTTLKDFQSILDNEQFINVTPALGETSADDYYVHDTFWLDKPLKYEHNAYIWADNIYQGSESVDDWNVPYKQVFYANVVLENIKNIDPTTEQKLWNDMMGSAYFIRGYALYNLAQVFCHVYDPAYLDKPNWGLPLRLESDVTEKVSRSTIRQTYERIIADLVTAVPFLQTSIWTEYRTRPNRPAAYALLSRVYLSMGYYEEARLYADSCLMLHSSLIDYNEPSILNAPNLPFNRKNAESMYYSIMNDKSEVMRSVTYRNIYVDSNLFKMYASNDLRKTVFFNTTTSRPFSKGSYSQSIFRYSGLATDEVYITRAECHARAGRIGDAVTDLNTLLEKRYRKGTFTPYSSSLSQQDALALILRERRKQLPFRGRWTDIRRLNKEGANISLKRTLDNITYTLPANDLRFVLPIPPDVVRLGDIPDNERN